MLLLTSNIFYDCGLSYDFFFYKKLLANMTSSFLASSDHLVPTMRPLNMIDNLPARAHRKITVRPLHESLLAILQSSLKQQSWLRVLEASTANDKANIFQEVAMMMINEAVPEKVRKVSSDDQDWYTESLKRLDRRRQR